MVSPAPSSCSGRRTLETTTMQEDNRDEWAILCKLEQAMEPRETGLVADGSWRIRLVIEGIPQGSPVDHGIGIPDMRRIRLIEAAFPEAEALVVEGRFNLALGEDEVGGGRVLQTVPSDYWWKVTLKTHKRQRNERSKRGKKVPLKS